MRPSEAVATGVRQNSYSLVRVRLRENTMKKNQENKGSGSWGLSWDMDITLNAWLRYVLAVVICAIALALRLIILPVESGLAFLTFYPVSAVTAILLGTGPAVLAIAICTVIGQYIFMPPYSPHSL